MAVQPYSPRESIEMEGDPLLSLVDSAFEPEQLPLTVAKKKKKPWVLFVILVFAMVSIIDIGAFLADPPKTRVFEANICLGYYQEHDPSVIGDDGTIPEKLCKLDEIQQKLAMIFGWQETFDAIPGILLAVPLGTMADRRDMDMDYGHQLTAIGYFKTLPLQWTWLSSLFFFIGGGPIVAMAIGITMLSDIVPPEKRTSIFLYLTATVLVSEMMAPILAARLMDHGDWFPLVLALAIQQAGISLAFVVPETLHMRDLPEPKDGVEEVVVVKPTGSHFTIRSQIQNFRTAIIFLRSDWTLALVVFTFMANRLGSQSLSLIVRYASKRYGWEIKKAAYLLSLRAATNLVAITVFIPLTNLVLLKKFRLPAHWADLYLARGSIILTTISFFVMGIAAYPALLVIGLLIFNLGTGYSAAMRSIAIHVVGGQSSPDVGKLMSTIAIAEAFGAMVAGPMLSQMFQWGMDLGSAWTGLPFLMSVVFFAAMTMANFLIDFKDKEVAYMEVRRDDEDVGGDVDGAERAMTSGLEDRAIRRSIS
ncbi:similar to MFS transporter [Plenodomus lingam JN3]|uniref:Similar to MFS transporter n=1 Tax=Leptosphaeria maculans (strain JN3 / isolate v23.1.3 / race Av1-4-5-6-7-8) TaxID=985895 RepID=E5ACB0_LEPMJ|nr:similar to MFS transporter [Plenodomus lingam JN3]CBY02112.1 similar to MFS transporter [Plenodomus lingam JN3]